MELVKELFSSKKFTIMLMGLVVSVAVRMGLDPAVAQDLVPVVMGIVISYVIGQGIADHGKSAAMIVAAASSGAVESPPLEAVQDKGQEE